MNYTVLAYLLYLPISIAMTIWVARTLHRNGRVFIIAAFRGNDSITANERPPQSTEVGMREPPLNTDRREWALQEIARLEAENAMLREQIASMPPRPDISPPDPPGKPPKPEQRKSR